MLISPAAQLLAAATRAGAYETWGNCSIYTPVNSLRHIPTATWRRHDDAGVPIRECALSAGIRSTERCGPTEWQTELVPSV